MCLALASSHHLSSECRELAGQALLGLGAAAAALLKGFYVARAVTPLSLLHYEYHQGRETCPVIHQSHCQPYHHGDSLLEAEPTPLASLCHRRGNGSLTALVALSLWMVFVERPRGKRAPDLPSMRNSAASCLVGDFCCKIPGKAACVLSSLRNARAQSSSCLVSAS